MSDSSWASWLWGSKKRPPMRATDAAHDPALRARFITLLDNTDPPASFKASEVAQSLTPQELRKLGYEVWQDAVDGVKELAFELRAFGDCEIIRQGRLVPEDVSAYEVEGGVRIRRKDGSEDLDA